MVVDPAIYDGEGPDAHPVGLRGSERDGGYAEYVTAPVERVHGVTEAPLTDDQLATLPTAYGTALGMIERGRLQERGTVLVSGTSGGVGLALVPIALARGARVLAISSGSELDAVREAGAHEVIDRAQGLSEQIRAVAPEGIAVALDVVAGLHPARTPQSAMAAQRRGPPIRVLPIPPPIMDFCPSPSPAQTDQHGSETTAQAALVHPAKNTVPLTLDLHQVATPPLPLLPAALPAQAWGTAAPQAAAAAAVPLPGAAPAQEVLPLFEAIDRRYFKPSAEAIAEVTSLLAPGDSR